MLSDASQRQHFLKNPEGRKDWRGFFGAVGDDRPLRAVPALLGLLDPGLTVVLLSARPAWVFEITLEWLERHAIRWDLLVLARRRPVPRCRRVQAWRACRSCRSRGFVIELALDDDDAICAMYHGEELQALYVHSGYYAAPAPRSGPDA